MGDGDWRVGVGATTVAVGWGVRVGGWGVKAATLGLVVVGEIIVGTGQESEPAGCEMARAHATASAALRIRIDMAAAKLRGVDGRVRIDGLDIRDFCKRTKRSTHTSWSVAQGIGLSIQCPRQELNLLLSLRRAALYPVSYEGAHHADASGEAGIRTLGGGFSPLNRLAGGSVRPLRHLPGERRERDSNPR